MKLYFVALAGVLLLAGCGKEQPPAPAPSNRAEAPPEVPVMGAEVTVLALGDSLFTGYGLGEGDSYPARLERALRARGINARIANAGVSGDTSAGGLQRLVLVPAHGAVADGDDHPLEFLESRQQRGAIPRH